MTEQARLFLSPPDVGSDEESAVAEAVRSGWVAPLGPCVNGFEEDMATFTGSPAESIAALSSGTAALELAMKLVGVTSENWVLIPTKTFVASPNAVAQLGAESVFVDVDRETWNLDVERTLTFLDAEAAVGNLPGAVMWVDLYGTCSDSEALTSWCAEHEVPIVEDAAEAVGSSLNGQSAGRLGTIGAFSFNGNKIMTTSGGGMLLADPETAARARWLASQAREPGDAYVHRERGYNYRMSNICAAIGQAQLRRLPGMIERRREVRAVYEQAFVQEDGLALNPVPNVESTNCWLTLLELPAHVTPSEVIAHLEGHNIEARRSWNPMHQQPLYADSRVIGGEVADELFDKHICLPSGSVLTTEDQQRVIALVREAIQTT